MKNRGRKAIAAQSSFALTAPRVRIHLPPPRSSADLRDSPIPLRRSIAQEGSEGVLGRSIDNSIVYAPADPLAALNAFRPISHFVGQFASLPVRLGLMTNEYQQPHAGFQLAECPLKVSPLFGTVGFLR
jgi:hypothetical protein